MPKETTPSAKHFKNQTIAVVGTASFTGSHILKELTNDPDIKVVVAVDHKKPALQTKKTNFHKINLTETLADVQLAEVFKKEKVDTVIHCAMPVTPPKSQSYAHELISIGTMYILNACAEARIKKIIMASTTDVYGAFPNNPNFLLEDVHMPRGDRQSKFLADRIDAENQALRYAKKHPDCSVTILRPCSIFGPTIQTYKTRLLRRFFVATVLGFDPLIQFLHEDDLIRAFKLAIEKDCRGIFNIVGDGVLPLSRIIKIAGKIHVELPQIGFKTLVQLLWYADFSPAPATHVNFLRYLCVADGSKAKEKLGFVPHFSTKETLLSFVGAERLREIRLIEA